MPDGYMSTLMGGTQTYYDEDGVRHHHEVNSSTGRGHCSLGHDLDVNASTRCPAPGCEYGRPLSITYIPPKPAASDVAPQYLEFKNVQITFPSGL